MSVAPHWRIAMCFLWLNPYVLFSIENSKRAVILLAVIATEDPKFALVESCCMILYLRSATDDGTQHSLCRYRGSWSIWCQIALFSAHTRACSDLIGAGGHNLVTTTILCCCDLGWGRFWDKSPRQLSLLFWREGSCVLVWVKVRRTALTRQVRLRRLVIIIVAHAR